VLSLCTVFTLIAASHQYSYSSRCNSTYFDVSNIGIVGANRLRLAVRTSSSLLITIRVSGIACEAFTPNSTIFVRSMSSDVTVFFDVYTKWEFKFIQHIMTSDPLRILDLGGNCGMTAKYFASFYPESKVVVVEPDPKNYKILRLNTAHLPNVFAEHGSVGIESNMTFAAVQHNKAGHWGTGVVPSGVVSESVVPILTIPFIMAKFSWQSLDYVKIDIEGSERGMCSQLLKGDSGWLHKLVGCLSIELHDRKAPQERQQQTKTCYAAFQRHHLRFTGKFGELDTWCKQP